MPAVIETGSDIAMLCVYDPAALPEDFDARSARDRTAAIEAAHRDARLLAIPTGGDGTFVFHFYTENQPDGSVMNACSQPASLQELAVPSGTVRATGAECVQQHGDAAAPEQETFQLRPGRYALKFWRATWTESQIGAETKKRELAAIGESAYARRARRAPWMMAAVILLLLAGAFCIFATIGSFTRELFGWKMIAGFWLGWIALIQIVPRWLNHPDDRRAALASLATRREFPDFVVQLGRIESPA